MGASSNPDRAKVFLCVAWAGLALVTTALLWRYPLWRVVALSAPARPAQSAHFDAVEFAAHFWTSTLPSLRAKATDARELIDALRADPAAAVRNHAHTAGLGHASYFVRGTGRVTLVEPNRVVLALAGTDGATVALPTGPIFGNTVRDGLAVLNVNDFPSLTEFNGVAAELNRQVELHVLPELRRLATVGASIDFAGCAEATDAGVDGRQLTLVPVFADAPPAR